MSRISLCAAGAAIALAGCASQLPVTGNETSVVIGGTADVATAFPLAEKHCANYGKVAHFEHVEGFRVEFDCDPKQLN